MHEIEAARGGVLLALDAVLIYGEPGTELRASYVLECKARVSPGAPRFNWGKRGWDVLWEATTSKIARNEVSAQDMVLLSMYGGREMPDDIKLWLERWLERRTDKPFALVASVDAAGRERHSATQMISWLQAGTGAKNVTVMTHFRDTPRCADGRVAESIPKRALTQTGRWTDVEHRPELSSDLCLNE